MVFGLMVELYHVNVMNKFNSIAVRSFWDRASLVARTAKNPPAIQKTWV